MYAHDRTSRRSASNGGTALGIALLLLALGLVGPAAAQVPVIDPPVPTLADATIVPAAGNQSNPWVTAGGPGFLAVWTDARTTVPSGNLENESQSDVYAIRLDATGQPLDAAPFVISADFGHQRYARAAWNGASWLVVWVDQKPSGFYYAQHLFGMRVGADGTLLDAEPFPIIRYDNSSSLYVDLTAQGSDWLVITEGTSSGETGILGARVTAAGAVLDDPPQVLVPPNGGSLYSGLTVRAAGGEILVVYVDGSYTFGQRFAGDLTPIGAAFPLPGTKIASNGSSYYAAWWQGADIVGSPMALDGTLAFPAGVPITQDVSFSFMIQWGGTQWWLMYLNPIEEIKLARIDTAGTVLDFGGFPLDADPIDEIQHPFLSDGLDGSVQVAWTQYDAAGIDPNDIHTAHVAAGGAAADDLCVSSGAPLQLRPELVYGPGEFLLASRSQRSGLRQLTLQRLDGDGVPLDSAPLLVAEGANLGPHAVEWNGSLYLVVWADGLTVFGRRYDAGLTPLDPAPFPILAGTSPDLAALDGDFLVVATQQTSSVHFFVTHGMRVGGDGSLLDTEAFPIGQYFARVPRVEAIAGRWLVLWQRNYSHDDTQGEVNGSWIAPDGTVDPYFTVSYNAFEPEIAYSGARALIVFRKGSEAAAQHDIGARLMLPDGSMPEPELYVSTAADRQRAPHVAWDGNQFLMAWEDKREALDFFDERSDIYAARISELGAIVDPDAFPIARGVDPAIQPNVVSGGGDTLVAAALFDRSQGVTAYRVSTFRLDGGTIAPPSAAFLVDRTEVCAPGTVGFTDTSTGLVDRWEWSFGDGGASSEQHPLHTYTQEGIYTVFMTARGSGGADTRVREDLLAVSGGVTASFLPSVTSGCAPLDVSFQDLSAGFPSSWAWQFGDDAFSTERSPTHTYEYPGRYTVELTASGCGSSTSTRIELIQIDEMCPNSALATGEAPVHGSVTNDYTWTHAKDAYYQVLQEETFGGGPNVSTRLEHRWSFTVEPGISVDFHADIFPYAAFFEPLAFEYSTDGSSFLPLAVITQDTIREVDAPLPASLTGQITIRLIDLDREPGDDFRNTVLINHLRVDSGVAPPEHGCEAVIGAAFVDRQQLDWLGATSATHYDVVRGDLALLRANGGIGDALCGADDAASTTHVDTEMPAPGSGFYYVIRGDTETMPVGTYDNPPGRASADEGRDGEAGTAGGSTCTQRY